MYDAQRKSPQQTPHLSYTKMSRIGLGRTEHGPLTEHERVDAATREVNARSVGVSGAGQVRDGVSPGRRIGVRRTPEGILQFPDFRRRCCP